MEKPKLEVRVEDKYLDVNGNRFALDGSFFYAGIASGISDEGDEIAVELKYRAIDEDSLDEEGGEIHDFLGRLNLRDTIDVNPCPDGADFPTIALTGDYAASIHR